jgi:hypothetical protein
LLHPWVLWLRTAENKVSRRDKGKLNNRLKFEQRRRGWRRGCTAKLLSCLPASIGTGTTENCRNSSSLYQNTQLLNNSKRPGAHVLALVSSERVSLNFFGHLTSVLF